MREETISEKMRKIFPDGDIKVDRSGKGKDLKYIIEITQMYEYVEFSFSKLQEVSKSLGCEEISESRHSQEGCESCNYGSKFTIELTCWKFGKGHV